MADPRNRWSRVPAAPVRLSESLGAFTRRFGGGEGEAEVVTKVFGRWEELVGPAVAAHVTPTKLVDGTLVVTVDGSAWATQVRQMSPAILSRIEEVCGATGAPSRLEVRVRR